MRARGVLTSIAALATLVGGGAMRAQGTEPAGRTAPPSQVVTTGTGEARLTPDRAIIVLGVQTRATTAAQASADNARRARAVLDTVRSLGFTQDQLSTMNYNVYPETRFDRETQRQIPTGYVVSNSVRVEVRQIDQVGRAIDAALAKGANQVSSLSFYASNTDDARHRALASAVAQARGDADAMARAAGGSVGMLLELSTYTQPVRPMQRDFAAMSRTLVAEAPPPTPIEVGEQTLTITVSARWQFVAGR